MRSLVLRHPHNILESLRKPINFGNPYIIGVSFPPIKSISCIKCTFSINLIALNLKNKNHSNS